MKWYLEYLAREINVDNFKQLLRYLKIYGPGYTLKLALLRLQKMLFPKEKPPEPEIFLGSDHVMLLFKTWENPLVSIVIPVHNQWAYTYSCLQSILKNTGGISYEVIVADDVSSDETQNIGNYIRNIRSIRNEANLGFLRNCNNAVMLAKGKYVLLLNNDTNVQEGWLRYLVDLLERDQRVGMAGPKLIYPTGRLQEAGGIVWRDASAFRYGHFENPLMPEYNYVKEVDYISGACIIIRRSLWEEIGGFDDRFAPAYAEDADIAFEVRKRGYRVAYQPKSVVVHFEGASHGINVRKGVKQYQVVNKDKFAQKWKEVLEEGHFETGQNIFWARDRSGSKKTIVVIDHYIPQHDKDAGSRTMQQYLQLFIEMGLNVKFIGDDFIKSEPYASLLEQAGIEVLSGMWYKAKWKEWIKANAKYIDYVFLSRPYISIKYIDFLRENIDSKILYYGHDLNYYREMRRYEIEKDERFLKTSKEWKGIESKVIDYSDIVFTLSEVERDIIRSDFPSKDVRIMPVFIYDEISEEPWDFRRRENLLFVGGFGHPPNVDGIVWFAKSIFPLVLDELPGIKLYIAGSNTPKSVLDLKSSNIEVTGYLSEDDLSALYRDVKVVVIPLRYGAGVKGKTIEAMYNGVPIVSTDVGIEGLENIRSIIEPRNSEADFAREVISIYNDTERLGEMSLKYRAYVNKCCSREQARSVMESALDRKAVEYE